MEDWSNRASDNKKTTSKFIENFPSNLTIVIFALMASVMAVAFVSSYLGDSYQKRYRAQVAQKTYELLRVYRLGINGDDLGGDMEQATKKYANVLPALIINSNRNGQSQKYFALYAVQNNSLQFLVQNKTEGFITLELNSDAYMNQPEQIYIRINEDQINAVTPILNQQGQITGVLELVLEFSFLGKLSYFIENSVLYTALFSALMGIFLFVLLFLAPKIIRFLGKKGDMFR